MTYLGIDFGTKRIGVAYSDASGAIAVPQGVLKNDSKMFDRLQEIINERMPQTIVVGRSRNLKGELNKVQKDIEKFKVELKIHFPDLKIEDQDEFLTSSHVEEKGELLDASAAALILQRYLERQKYIEQKSSENN